MTDSKISISDISTLVVRRKLDLLPERAQTRNQFTNRCYQIKTLLSYFLHHNPCTQHLQVCLPVIAIFADHLLVPSTMLCCTAFLWLMWVRSSMEKMFRIISNVSGCSFSLNCMRSRIVCMILCVLSSEPCFEDFSAAPEEQKQREFINLHTQASSSPLSPLLFQAEVLSTR